MELNANEAAARLRVLYPSHEVTITLTLDATGGEDPEPVEHYAAAVRPFGGGTHWSGRGDDLAALIESARAIAPARPLSPADAHQIATGLAEVAGRDYTEAEHEKAGAKFVGNVAAAQERERPEY